LKPISKWAKELKGTLLITFMSQDGLKAVAQYHVSLLKLQAAIEGQLSGEAFRPEAQSVAQNALVRLIVRVLHDSQLMTSSLLNSFIIQGKENKSYLLADAVEDSGDPAVYTSLQHFFANHFNQLLSILAAWAEPDADFAAMIERDARLSYQGCESVLVTLIKELASNFVNCPMLKDNFLQDQPRGFFAQNNRAGQNNLQRQQ